MVRVYLLVAALIALILAPSPSPAQTGLLRFRLLPQESQILTNISDPFGLTITGTFTLQQGEARGRLDDLKGTGWVRLVIDTASYNSNLGPRDQDVQDNYLEAKDYPLITFTSTAIDEIRELNASNEAWQLTIRGSLELHGLKREIKMRIRLTRQGSKMIAEGTTQIHLQDFKIAVPTFLFFRSGDQAEVTFRFVGEQQL